MPVRKLPNKLVERLKRLVERERAKHGSELRAYKLLGRMKNIDYRKGMTTDPADITQWWGRRVRLLDVSRNFPRLKGVVIKRTHDAKAETVVNEIKIIVRKHNKKFKPRNYLLLEPNAYPIGKHLLAMARTNRPNLREILRVKDRTKRGMDSFSRMKKKHGVTQDQLWNAQQGVFRRTKISMQNLVLVGFRNGKFVFVPLLDLL